MTGRAACCGVALALLVACASAPPSGPLPSTPVPPERVLATPPPVADPSQAATVTFSRDIEYDGSGKAVVVGIDGVDLAELRIGESFTFQSTPGAHKVMATLRPQEASRSLDVTLEPGSSRHFDASVATYGLYLEEVGAGR